jgi:hypothetical protein
MVSTSCGDMGGCPGLACFFMLPVALNCSTHLRMLLREGGAPYIVLNFLCTEVTDFDPPHTCSLLVI